MKRIVVLFVLISLLVIPVNATEFIAPEVPEAGEKYMPEDTQSFAEGIWYVLKSAIEDLQPSIWDASGICLSVLAIVILVAVVQSLSKNTQKVTAIAGTIAVGVLLIQPTSTLIGLGSKTITDINEYGKLLIPVITAALAAQGGINTSTALYVGTTVFCTVLTTLISKLLVPIIYVFICLSVAGCAIGEDILDNLKKLTKWLMTWSLKTILYIFTGFLSITGVVSGSADASALKAAKLTISGFVPVVGGILSDASEAVLVGAGVMKNTAGLYGMFAIIALWIGPFLQIGIQYLMIKLTASVSNIFGTKQTCSLIQDFSDAMGLILAMTGAICIMLLISIVCFMKGVA